MPTLTTDLTVTLTNMENKWVKGLHARTTILTAAFTRLVTGSAICLLTACLIVPWFIPANSFAGVSAKPSISPSKATDQADDTAWVKLTAIQQKTLAPLATEWNKFEADGKKKWLEIADKFQSMKQAEQARVQQKMQAWSKLTPEQRVMVRENYIRSNKLKPDQRNEKWKEYQQLSNAQKLQLAAHSDKKNLVTNLPSPAESKLKKLQPLKLSHRTQVDATARGHTPTATDALSPPPPTPQAAASSAVTGLLVSPSGTISGLALPPAPPLSAPMAPSAPTTPATTTSAPLTPANTPIPAAGSTFP